MSRRGVLAGGTAGLVLGLTDWAASGLGRVPATLAAVEAAGGLIAGLAAGCVAGLLAGRAGGARAPRLAAGLVLAGGIAVEGLALASKELDGPARGACLVLVGLAAGAAVRLALGAVPGAVLLAIALVPGGMLLAALAAAGPWGELAGLLLPLAALAAERATLPSAGRRAARGAAAVAVLAALVLAQRDPTAGRRRALPPPATSAGAGPNVVLLVVDTLRADALDPAGPIAAFARGGTEFRRCVSAAPWTLPAMGALLTGLYPSEHGAVDAGAPLPEELVTLAEHLRAAGWATGAFTGGAFVGPAHRLDQGFDVFDAMAERGFAPFGAHVPLAWRIARNRYVPLRWLVRLADEQRGLAGVLDAALTWAAGEPRRPKLVLLHTYQVHDYYLYDADTDDAVLRDGPPVSARFAGRLSVHPSELRDASAADLAHFRAIYDARVAAVEALFPRLVAELGAALGGETVWIVTADHGEGFDAELGRVHHGGRLHEDLLHVPLVMRGPGLAAGRAVDAPVRSVDVLPTVLDLVGLPVPEGLAGASLLPALRGERPFPAVLYAEEHAHGLELLAARIGERKALRSPAGTETFDLAKDPREHAPLAGPTAADLQAALEGFGALHPARPRAAVELDDATREHLRSLGYIE